MYNLRGQNKKLMYCDVPRLFVSADSDCRLRLLTDLFLVRLYIRYSGNVALHHPVLRRHNDPRFLWNIVHRHSPTGYICSRSQSRSNHSNKSQGHKVNLHSFPYLPVVTAYVSMDMQVREEVEFIVYFYIADKTGVSGSMFL